MTVAAAMLPRCSSVETGDVTLIWVKPVIIALVTVLAPLTASVAMVSVATTRVRWIAPVIAPLLLRSSAVITSVITAKIVAPVLVTVRVSPLATVVTVSAVMAKI